MPGLWLSTVLGALQVQAMPGALALGSVLSVEPLMVLLAARWLGSSPWPRCCWPPLGLVAGVLLGWALVKGGG